MMCNSIATIASPPVSSSPESIDRFSAKPLRVRADPRDVALLPHSPHPQIFDASLPIFRKPRSCCFERS
jgi:hypothetical protein